MSTSVIQDNGSLHKYRTEIPNIIFELGLDSYALAVYMLFKKIAGDNGKCWASQETIAKMCGMGLSKLRETKKLLQQPFELLDGSPLITVTKRPDSGESDVIVIVDIWDKNCSHIANKNKIKGAPPNEPPPSVWQTPPPPPGGGKEEPLKKNHKEEPSSSLSPPLPESKEEFKRMMMKILPFANEDYEEAYKRYLKMGSSRIQYPDLWFEAVIKDIQGDKKSLQDDEKPNFLEYTEEQIRESVERIQRIADGDLYATNESRKRTASSV